MSDTDQRFAVDIDADTIAAVREQDLPESILPLIDAYVDIVGDRDRFLWQWLYHLFPTFSLSCLDASRAREARNAKLTASIFVTVADDVAERHGDRATFDELTSIPFDHRRPNPERPDVDGDVVRFLMGVWDEFATLYDAGPRSKEFGELLQFDLQQALQAIEYSSLTNRYPGLVSERELWTYDVHNMLVFPLAGIDLSNAPSFDSSELSSLRQVLDRTQRMARIGNWISTWKRELAEGDCSSGVVVHALENDVVSPEQVQAVRRNPTDATVDPVVDAITDAGVEDYFLDQWEVEHKAVGRFESEIESVDVGAYLEGFETVLRYHVASEGKK